MNRIEAAAANIADWHDCSLRALGRETRRTNALWSCESGPGIIYLMAITLGSRDDDDRQLDEIGAFANRRWRDRVVVADSWDSLGLGTRGYLPSPYGAIVDWYWRSPELADDVSAVRPPELVIEEVTDPEGLKHYEQVSAGGFGSEEMLDRVGTFGIHAPGILDDPRMKVFVGRVNGTAVTGAMAYVSDDVIGVYGVTTPPEHRRRGTGRRLPGRR